MQSYVSHCIQLGLLSSTMLCPAVLEVKLKGKNLSGRLWLANIVAVLVKTWNIESTQ